MPLLTALVILTFSSLASSKEPVKSAPTSLEFHNLVQDFDATNRGGVWAAFEDETLTMKTDDQDSLNKQIWTLQEASAELSAIAYLFRLKRKDEVPPLDMDGINWGLSRILDRMARQIKRAARQIEETKFKHKHY